MLTPKRLLWLAGLSGIGLLFVAICIYRLCFIDKSKSNTTHSAILSQKEITTVTRKTNNGQKQLDAKAVTTRAALSDTLPQDVDLASDARVQKALVLLEYPPPNDDIQVTDTVGPAVAAPRYEFQTGDHYRIRSYQILTGPGIEKDLPDWMDQGVLDVEVQKVDPNTQAATLSYRSTSPMKGVVGVGALSDMVGKTALQEYQVVLYPDGRAELPESLELGGDTPVKINMGSKGVAGSRFPEDKELAIGDTWKLQSEQGTDINQTTQFTFEGYSLVGDVKCMRIKEVSSGIRSLTVGAANFKAPIRLKVETQGYHYFDMSRGLRFRADLVMEVQSESDDPQLSEALGSKEIRVIRQVVK